MADPRTAIQNALKDAMKNKDSARRDVLRLLTSAIKQVEIDEQKTLSDDEVITILQKEAKKRRESIVELEGAGRAEQAQQEHYELALLEEFLPRQLTPDEIEVLVREAVARTGASSMAEMGQVMGLVMEQVKGLADGKAVNAVVRKVLSS